MTDLALPTAHSRRRATLIGSIAVLLWATLALFTASTGAVPPFQLMATTFAIAFAFAALKWLADFARKGPAAFTFLRQPWPVWALGIGGLFLYHLFYFVALDHAPAVEASLIAYLWPLLIVLFSALLPGERLYWQHVAGAIIGMAGAALLILARDAGDAAGLAGSALGYGAALACAFTWSIYSVLSRRFGTAPTELVGAFCGVTALLGFLCHLLTETTIWPADQWQWLAIIALGLGPVGAAFFVWDYGVKKGDIKALGAISYASPLISTLLLIATGKASATMAVLLGCLAIVGGAVLAARDLYMKR
ncbi:EamA domain-containing membrane protein RarD [Dongia mobilis]|uniref:EamA domain-containing membrane protein RarD n=1 Tax=Dongia mobilis TaxID=578943 RepID=A0A4R6WVB2_9PROT|nr:DMT family transporter [Dongia mobilis]TDQ81049.1 EamA domain-containing membrane protein RarD [Dongia mobilis]